MSIAEGELTALAFCWRLERRDGVCLGFTTHDRDLTVGGLTYRAAPGLVPSAISQSDGFDADALEVAGAITSDAITERDLTAGRWDAAAVSVFMVDWEHPDRTPIPLARGDLGDVSVKASGFETEVKGPTARLSRPPVEQTSPHCRARLGDQRCRVDMAARTRLCRVVSVSGEDQFEVSDPEPEPNAYGYGRVRWLTGANSGLESTIASSAAEGISLREPSPEPPAAGDLVELTEGCDRSFATCIARFSNAANFRGEPHLPGMDLLTRYPGS